MLTLTIKPAKSAISARANHAPQVWRDESGGICAYGSTHGHSCWMDFPGLAKFWFNPRSDNVLAFAEEPLRTANIRDVFCRFVLPMAIQAHGKEVLHASAVESSHGIVAICGHSGAGKSTTGYALSRRGYRSWSDDALLCSISGRSADALPLPFRVRLHHDTEVYFGESPQFVEERREFRCLDAPPTPITAICILSRLGNDVTPRNPECRRLARTDAFFAVLPHAFWFEFHDPDRKRIRMQNFLNLASQVPVFDLRFCEGLERLPELIDAIERIVPPVGQSANSRT